MYRLRKQNHFGVVDYSYDDLYPSFILKSASHIP